jgi:hypothetical protein
MKREVGLRHVLMIREKWPGLKRILLLWRLHVYGVRLVANLSSDWLRR